MLLSRCCCCCCWRVVPQVYLPWWLSHWEEYHTGVLMYGDGNFGILEVLSLELVGTSPRHGHVTSPAHHTMCVHSASRRPPRQANYAEVVVTFITALVGHWLWDYPFHKVVPAWPSKEHCER